MLWHDPSIPIVDKTIDVPGGAKDDALLVVERHIAHVVVRVRLGFGHIHGIEGKGAWGRCLAGRRRLKVRELVIQDPVFVDCWRLLLNPRPI
jgi:hypothetical protein